MALSERHLDPCEGYELAAAGQGGPGQINCKRRQYFHPCAGLLEGVSAVADHARAEMAFARRAILGALFFTIHEHLVLDALGAPGATRLVAAGLLLPRLLNRALGVAQRIRCTIEVGFGTGPRGVALVDKGRPASAENGDTDRRQLDDAIDAFEQ